MSELGLDGRPEPYRGAVSSGCALGCGLQLAVFVGAIVLSVILSRVISPSAADRAAAVVIICAWIVVVPLARKKAGEGEIYTRDGLILSACLGVLISTTCGAFILHY